MKIFKVVAFIFAGFVILILIIKRLSVFVEHPLFSAFFLALILTLGFLSSRRSAIKEGSWFGFAGAKAAYRWNHASPEQRGIRLGEIGISGDLDGDSLVNKQWSDIPGSIQRLLVQK